MDRREFLTILGGVVAAAGAADAMARTAVAANMAMQGGDRQIYTFFTAEEVAFVKAAVARLIPADDLGPGALEADVPYFLDQQLAGVYGAGARYYSEGPFGAT